mmetsp:Transcript_1056/g.3900  ORF Transcript_1056/g.3900 Transcript_1056/m.3900 type:complete len:208 (-) Transcript_1056:779-1402(-)
MPEAPARPVRPLRWMYVSGSFGGSLCTTSATPDMSSPRAATSVATKTWKRPLRKPSSVDSRVACGMSPWSSLAPALSPSVAARLAATSLASRFVSVKTMVRPLHGARERTTSAMSGRRVCHWHGRSKCVTLFDAFNVESPTKSTVTRPSLKYFFAMSSTHDGSVALKSSVCIGRDSAAAAAAVPAKMVSTSSANPIFNISSASSSTR